MKYMIELRVVGFMLGCISLYIAHLNYKRKIFNKSELAIWTILWIGFLTIVLSPMSISFLLETFQLSRISDLIMIVAFIILYALTFFNYIGHRQLQAKTDAIVRKIALKDIEEKKLS